MIEFAKKFYITKEKLRELYLKKNLTTYQIAKLYNCCQATVWKKLHEYKIKPRLSGVARVNLSKKKLKKLYVKNKLSTWKIEKGYGYPRGTIHRKLKEYGIKTRNISESHIIYPRKSFDGNLFEKAYLIGFTIGDLRVRTTDSHETIYVDCGSTSKAQVDLFTHLFQKYGKVWVSGSLKNNKRQMEVRLNKSFSFLFDKDISWIFDNKKFFFAFLAGFIDAEGSIFITKRNQANFAIGNYNSSLLNKIHQKLNELGVECRIPIEDNRKGKVNSEGYKYAQNYWHLSINKKKSLTRLFNLIEPYIKHANKIKSIETVRENIDFRNKNFGYINMS